METKTKNIYTQKLFDQLTLQLVFENLYISLLGSYTIHEHPDKHVLGDNPYGLITQTEGLVFRKIPQREHGRVCRGEPLKSCESINCQYSFWRGQAIRH